MLRDRLDILNLGNCIRELMPPQLQKRLPVIEEFRHLLIPQYSKGSLSR